MRFVALCALIYLCGACGSSSSSGGSASTCSAMSPVGFYATTSAPYTPVGSSTVAGDLVLPDSVWSQFVTLSEGGTAQATIFMLGSDPEGQSLNNGTWTSSGDNIQITFESTGTSNGTYVLDGTISQDPSTCIVTGNFSMGGDTVVHLFNDDAVTASFVMVQYAHDLTAADLAGTWNEDVLMSINNSDPSETIDELGGDIPQVIISSDGQAVFKNSESSNVGYIIFLNNYTVQFTGNDNDIITVDFVNNQMIMNTYGTTATFNGSPTSATTFRVFNKVLN